MDPRPSPSAIQSFVGVVRRRLRLAQAWRGLGWGAALAGAAALVLVLAGAAIGPSAWWRPSLWALACLGAVGAAMRTLRARERWRRDDAIARLVGERVPTVGDALWSAVELERELPRLGVEPILSPALVRAHQEIVAGRLADVDVRRLIRVRRLRAVAPAALVALAWTALATRAPLLLARGWAALTASGLATVATSREPIIGDLQMTLFYPAYTGLPPRVIPESTGLVQALPGTTVMLRARALVPIGEPALLLGLDGQAVRELPVAAHDGYVTARWVVERPGWYRFVLGSGARRVREPEAHRIELEPDRAPRVDLYVPADPLEVAGTRRIELAYSLEDDFGLGAVELVWRTGVEPERRKTIVPAAKPAPRTLAGKLEWDLGELDLKPGARVSYHLEARDNDNVGGPNVGRSKSFTLVTFSPREREERMLATQEQLLEATLALLADRLELRPSRDPARDKEAAALSDNANAANDDSYSRIHARAEALLASLTQAMQGLAPKPGADKPAAQRTRDLKDQLGEMHGRLLKLTQDEEQLLGDLRRRRRSHGDGLRALDALNAKHVSELERDALLLSDLLGRQRLEELLAVGDEMAHARDRLKQLLQQYKQTRSPQLKQEIERELRQLERKLAELAQKASSLMAELPDQFLNPDAMGQNDMRQRLDELRQRLAAGDVDRAMAELDKLSSKIDQMMAQMEQDLAGYRRERFTAEEKALAEAENKLADLAHDQQKLRADTEAIRQRARAEAQRQMRDKVEPLIKQLREQTAQLKKQLGALDKGPLTPYDQDELERIVKRADDADRMLGDGDLDEARGMAHQAHDGLRGLAMDLHDQEIRHWRRDALHKTREQVGQSEQLARQIADTLDKAMPKPSQLMNGDDAKQLAELAQQQQALGKRAQDLARELQKPRLGPDGKPAPAPIPAELPNGLREAGGHMERAQSELRRQAAREAVDDQGQALDKLQQLQQQAREQRRPRNQAADARMDKEPVRIPGAEEYQAPKEFRQDLLDAMKRAAPAEYKDQVKRYYEELVK